MCVRVIFQIRFPKKPREDRNLRALALALFGKPQNSRVRARSDFHVPISDGSFDFPDPERVPMKLMLRQQVAHLAQSAQAVLEYLFCHAAVAPIPSNATVERHSASQHRAIAFSTTIFNI